MAELWLCLPCGRSYSVRSRRAHLRSRRHRLAVEFQQLAAQWAG